MSYSDGEDRTPPRLGDIDCVSSDAMRMSQTAQRWGISEYASLGDTVMFTMPSAVEFTQRRFHNQTGKTVEEELHVVYQTMLSVSMEQTSVRMALSPAAVRQLLELGYKVLDSVEQRPGGVLSSKYLVCWPVPTVAEITDHFSKKTKR